MFRLISFRWASWLRFPRYLGDYTKFFLMFYVFDGEALLGLYKHPLKGFLFLKGTWLLWVGLSL